MESVDVQAVPARVAAETVRFVGVDPGDGRNGEHAPMNEDPDLVVVEPGRIGPLVERLPGRLVSAVSRCRRDSIQEAAANTME